MQVKKLSIVCYKECKCTVLSIFQSIFHKPLFILKCEINAWWEKHFKHKKVHIKVIENFVTFQVTKHCICCTKYKIYRAMMWSLCTLVARPSRCSPKKHDSLFIILTYVMISFCWIRDVFCKSLQHVLLQVLPTCLCAAKFYVKRNLKHYGNNYVDGATIYVI